MHHQTIGYIVQILKCMVKVILHGAILMTSDDFYITNARHILLTIGIYDSNS